MQEVPRYSFNQKTSN